MEDEKRLLKPDTDRSLTSESIPQKTVILMRMSDVPRFDSRASLGLIVPIEKNFINEVKLEIKI